MWAHLRPRGLLPAAFAIVRNGPGRVLLVRRADDGYWELPGGRIEVGESAAWPCCLYPYTSVDTDAPQWRIHHIRWR